MLAFAICRGLLTPDFTDGTTYERYETMNSLQFTDGIDIICTTPTCTIICDEDNQCPTIKIDASQSNILEITCSALGSCKNMILKSAAQLSTEINCTSIDSCKMADLNVSLSEKNVVNCVNNAACQSIDIHCPIIFGNYSNCYITCAGENACYFMSVFVKDNDSLNLICNGSQIDPVKYYRGGPEPPSSCYYSTIYCEETQSDLIFDYRWTCSTYDCCPFYKSCNKSTCIIDCETEDCTGYTIDGSLVTKEFVVTCGTQNINGGCQGTTIICPDNSEFHHPSCSVYCNGKNSCMRTIIQATYSYAVDVSCLEFGACDFIQLFANKSRSVSITSVSADLGVHFAGFEWNSEYDGSGSQWILPADGSNTSIYCYGFGCFVIGNIWINSSSISELSIFFNACGQCNTLSDCIYYDEYQDEPWAYNGPGFRFHCGLSDYSGDITNLGVFHVNNFFSNSWIGWSGHGCSVNQYCDVCETNQIIRANVAFIDDSNALPCVTANPTSLPTKNPTSLPSENPTSLPTQTTFSPTTEIVTIENQQSKVNHVSTVNFALTMANVCIFLLR